MDKRRLDSLSGDDKIVAEAKTRFERCQKWESTFRSRYIDDVKFANGDPENGYQWPNDLQKARIDSDRPTLTINKTAQHNLMIVNEARQQKQEVRIRPVGEGASFEAAEVYEGIVRHIEYISNAQSIYDEATVSQVEGGIGYWRVITDYANTDSFDQEIFLRPIRNVLSVYIDPDIAEKDGSDAKFAFIFDDVLKDDFIEEHPEFRDSVPSAPLGAEDSWISDSHIRVAEYYRISQKKDKVISVRQSDGTVTITRRSKINAELYNALKDSDSFKEKEITSNEVEWYKIAGDKIVDRRVGKNAWPGQYIPIVRLIGKETIIEGQMDRKGHTRALKDAQRMYNYNSSAAVEYGALQTKAPWIAPAQAIEEYTEVWENANTKNYSVLPYNHRDDDGQDIPAPQRIEPPQGAQYYVEERQLSAQDMMQVSGQYQDSLGQQSNAVSGKAINQRERQGDKATYHFIDNLAVAMRFTGKIIIDLIPKIYDTKRIISILAKDGAEHEIMIDPNAAKAYQLAQKVEMDNVKAIFNPNVGYYDVQSDVGPDYATSRQETFNALSQMMAQNPELAHIAGDLLFKMCDFDGADEVAERLKRMVPPQALGEGPNPQVNAMQQQLQKMSKLLEASMTELATLKLKYENKESERSIENYNSITKRLEAVLKHVVVTPKDSAQMLHDVMVNEHQTASNMAENQHAAGLDMMATQMQGNQQQ